MAEIESIVKKLQHHWAADGGPRLAPPLTPSRLSSAENRLQLKLPPLMRAIYLTANGFLAPLDMDQNGFKWWPIEELQSVARYEGGGYAFPESEGWYLFADYLGWSWAYACDLAGTTRYGAVCAVGTATERPVLIAPSLEEFVELYVADDGRLYAAADNDAKSGIDEL